MDSAHLPAFTHTLIYAFTKYFIKCSFFIEHSGHVWYNINSNIELRIENVKLRS